MSNLTSRIRLRILVGLTASIVAVIIAYDLFYSRIFRGIGGTDVDKLILPNGGSIQIHPHTYAPSPSRNHTAYVFLALGVQANQLNCPAAVESLVRIGGWDGHVFMLTDRDSCFDTPRIVRDSHINPDLFHIVNVHHDFGNGGVDVEHGFRKNRMASMALKAELFDYLPTHIQTIVYADCDIVFEVKDCPAAYMEAGPSWEAAKLKFNRVYYSPTPTASINLTTVAMGSISSASTTARVIKPGVLLVGAKTKVNELSTDGIHCGTFVAHREHSKLAMKLWSMELQTLENMGDNLAYYKAYLSLEKEIERRGLRKNVGATIESLTPKTAAATSASKSTIPMLRSVGLASAAPSMETSRVVTDYVQEMSNEEFKSKFMLANGVQNILEPGEIFRDSYGDKFEKFFDPDLKGTCMLHISKARCSTYGRDSVQKVVERLDLASYHKSPASLGSSTANSGGKAYYPYCSHPYLQPVLYGWFPFSWLPFCPKVETIL